MPLHHRSTLAHEIPAEVEDLAEKTIDACWRVFKGLGPGLLESTYARALEIALIQAGLDARREVWIDAVFDGIVLHKALRLDFVVNEQIILELKCVPEVKPAHEAQLISYLGTPESPLGSSSTFTPNTSGRASEGKCGTRPARREHLRRRRVASCLPTRRLRVFPLVVFVSLRVFATSCSC